MICTFFGHRDTPPETEPLLCTLLMDLICQQGADVFYVGNHGAFDKMVQRNLRHLQEEYPHIRCAVVLTKMPGERDGQEMPLATIYPEGLETVPPKYAISARNRWMLSQADCVIGYIAHSFGGAAQFYMQAKRNGKIVYNLYE